MDSVRRSYFTPAAALNYIRSCPESAFQSSKIFSALSRRASANCSFERPAEALISRTEFASDRSTAFLTIGDIMLK